MEQQVWQSRVKTSELWKFCLGAWEMGYEAVKMEFCGNPLYRKNRIVLEKIKTDKGWEIGSRNKEERMNPSEYFRVGRM